MKKVSTLLVIFWLVNCSSVMAQQTLTATTPMLSPKASISQTVGITEIKVVYSRPAVNNRDVWGKVVRFSPGPSDDENTKVIPWRAGANENTVVSFSTDVFIDKTPVKAGSYGLHLIVESNGIVHWQFSSNTKSWGSYYYSEDEIIASVQTKWQDYKPTERLTYQFDSLKNESVELSLIWGAKRIPVPINVNVKATTLASLQQEIQGKHMINYMGPQEAADWCLRNDTNLVQALQWIDYSISFVKVFSNLKTKSDILQKTGKAEEAEKLMNEALAIGSVFEIYQYAATLLKEGKHKEALHTFEFNAEKFPDEWPVNYGLATAYSAMEDYKAATKYINLEIKNNANERRASFLNQKLELLKKGEGIN